MEGFDFAIALNVGGDPGSGHCEADEDQGDEEHDGDEDEALFRGFGAADWGGQ